MDPGPSDAFYSFDFLEGHRWDPGPSDASPHGLWTFQNGTGGPWAFRNSMNFQIFWFFDFPEGRGWAPVSSETT